MLLLLDAFYSIKVGQEKKEVFILAEALVSV